jgi:hypothetical protein
MSIAVKAASETPRNPIFMFQRRGKRIANLRVLTKYATAVNLPTTTPHRLGEIDMM